MASIDFNPLAQSVTVKYECPNCGHVNTDTFDIPSPDFSAETHHDSVNTDFYEVICENCDAEFDVYINNGFYGGDIEIEEVHKILSIEEEIPGEDDDYIEKQLYYLNYTEIDRLLEISAGIPEDAKLALYKLLYANAITMMETFLGDTLKREVLKDDDSIRKFVENYTPFEKEEIKLSNLYHKKETLPQYIREILNSLMYHDLRKIKPIFRDTLGVDLGDVSDLYRAVLVRHDIVHRNGVKKDGLEHHITKEDVQNLQKNVQELIESVKAQL